MRRPTATPRWRRPPENIAASAEQYVLDVIAFYDRRARWHRRLYRFSGTVIILAGAALPLLTTLDFPGRDGTIAGVGSLVAVTTALRALYRWDVSWVLLRDTEIQLTHTYLAWRTRADRGQDAPAPAPEELLERIYRIRRSESSEFFKNLPDPATGPARAPDRPRSTAP
ncbi:DUF4231 domain-containing protein [Streptomyces marincola]|uniref:DUF4231 domain-containing protein n=1 Tax=Streptomyces marincola TaxID=2878388 RepID=UPI001CF55AA2|nr:DUF4231 domain-containing protein [Streptomyces marincola]UCM88817.1 DUF4231 domain-containing protein [Streptomyces marincola]